MRIFHMKIVREKKSSSYGNEISQQTLPQGVCCHFVSALFKCTFYAVRPLNQQLHNPKATPKGKKQPKGSKARNQFKKLKQNDTQIDLVKNKTNRLREAGDN